MPLPSTALPYASAGLLLLTLSSLGWRALGGWWKDRRHVVLLGAYVFLVICGLVVCLAIFRLNSGWLYGLGATVLVLAVSGSLKIAASKALPQAGRVIVLSLLIIGLPLLAAAGWAGYRESGLASQGRTTLKGVESALLASARSNQEAAGELASLSLVQSLNTSSAGLAALRQETLSRSLDFAILADTSGKVLLRTDQGAVTGDTLTGQLPWVSRVLNGEIVSGMAWDENGQLGAVAGVPVKRSGSQVGILLAGSIASPTYLARQSGRHSVEVIEETNRRVAAYSAVSSLDSQLALNDGLAYQASHQPRNGSFTVFLNNRHAVATADLQGTLDTSRSFRLITLSDE